MWDRIWDHHPTDARDDELLARERRSLRWAMILSRLRDQFGTLDGLRTVELGSGRGDLSTLLAERGARVTLLDASEKALTQARHRISRLSLKADFQRGDLFDPPRDWYERFDVALSSGVIEHFLGDERTESIRAHRGVLRPGGVAIISVPHARSIPYRFWKAYLELRGRWPYGVEKPYTRRELLRRAREAGFRQSQARCMEFWFSVSNQLGRTLLGRGPDLSGVRSRLDPWMGMVLLMFARR